MTATDTTSRPGRRTWRAAVVVFLTVFLGGLGITGAAALWSHNGTVTASVTTGSWRNELEAGWPWQPNIRVHSSHKDPHHEVVLVWNTVESTGTVIYTLAIDQKKLGKKLMTNQATPDRAGWILEFHQHDSPGGYPVALTATVDGVASAPVHLMVNLNEDGSAAVAVTH